MRFIGVALVSSAVVLGACGGGETKQEAAPGAQPATPAAAPAAAPGPVTAGTPAPITGKTVEIKMFGDAQGYRYEPANVTINAGDGLKFVVVNGGPHNVAFAVEQFAGAPDVRQQLDANLGADKMAELSSNLKMNPGDIIVLSFGGIKPGTYDYFCTPHLAMNMKGKVTVR